MTGTIKRLVRDRGFGFVADAQGTEYFFHTSGCLTPYDSLTEGAQVSFELGESKKGPRAEKLRAL